VRVGIYYYIRKASLILKSNPECCTNQSTLTAPRRKSLGIFKDRTWKWRLSLPYWMTSKVIEVAGMKAPSGWNWTLRAYSVIPFRSRAVGCAITGSLKGLQHLFASGQASPFDQIEDTGRTLLNVSPAHANTLSS
jgi:hypothetical protein